MYINLRIVDSLIIIYNSLAGTCYFAFIDNVEGKVLIIFFISISRNIISFDLVRVYRVKLNYGQSSDRLKKKFSSKGAG